MHKLNVLVAGSTGYIGIQLIKLLLKHNNILIKYLCGNSSVGKKISFFDKSLKFKKLPKIIKFKKSLLDNVDVIFTALPNGEAQEISKKLPIIYREKGKGRPTKKERRDMIKKTDYYSEDWAIFLISPSIALTKFWYVTGS